MSMPHSAQYSVRLVVPAVMREELADVEPDAAGADDRDPLARHPASHDDVGVAGDLRMIDAGNRRLARDDAGREHDIVEAREIVARRHGGRDASSTPAALDAAAVVAERLGEFVLSRECGARD